MQYVRFQNNARLSASMSIFIVIFLTTINFQVCKGSGTSKSFSTSEECARQCQDSESPKTCYYHFVLEYYTSNGAACNYCNVSETDPRINTSCQCIIGDGKEKTVFSINRMIPSPSIQVCNGDTLIIDVQNNADGIEAAIHWHGIFQNGYQYYDGTPYVTQCPILSNNIFRYVFKVKNSGTHFYHSHTSTHMLDGQYGSLIVRDPPSSNPHVGLYDDDLPEHVIVISDWMHELSTERMPGKYRDQEDRGQAAENFLINGRGNWTDPVTGISTNVPLSMYIVEKGKRYRFRMINACSTVCLIEVTIQKHPVLLIATDGENVEPIPVKTITMATGERVDFILTANQTVGQYWIHVRGLGECEKNQVYQLAILSYQGASELSLSPNPGYLMGTSQDVFNPPNSTNCGNDICVDQLCKVYLPNEDQIPVNQEADMNIILPIDFFNHSADIQNLLFNPNNKEYKRFFVAPTGSHLDSLVANISYQHLPSPLISQNDGYQYMCGNSTTCTEPCTCTNVYHIPLYAVVDVFTYDKKTVPLNHPFHLHGYNFCVLHSGQFVNPENKEEISDDDVNRELEAHSLRARNGNYTYCSPKDTVIVPTAGYIIIRFKADNPGWWLFHCHFAWHTATGMNVVFHVGNPSDLPPVPEGFPKCYNWKPKII